MKPLKSLLAYSTENRPIELFQYGCGPHEVLFMAGVHGDEREGVLILERFCELLEAGQFPLPINLRLLVIPVANPDGLLVDKRQNANGVDLNRNMPTKDWTNVVLKERYFPGSHPASEVESKMLVDLLNNHNFKFILSFHSFTETLLNTNGDCEEAALVMQKKNGLKISPDMGYPTPGSFGTYAGLERGIPTITFELLSDESTDTLWDKHKEAITDLLLFLSKKWGHE